MRVWMVIVLLAVVCLGVYWPHKNAAFVLDDYYTVVRNPLIKNPSLYKNIWSSRLFDAHQSSGYIKFGYYRPILQSSWVLDYRLFGLKAAGFQKLNLLIHALNCLLVYVLLWQLFGQSSLALKASLLFSVFPTQEWVVRYVTGRGDELSALFALISLFCLLWVFKKKNRVLFPIIIALVFLVFAALTREVAISYVLYAFLIYFYCVPIRKEVKMAGSINQFCFWWILIGILPLLLVWSMVPKLGNILALHLLYFASIGFCLWMAQLPVRWGAVIFAVFALVSFYQGRFWTTEETLLRHTRSLEWWPRTVVDQQLLMRYDDDTPGIKDMVDRSQGPLIKAMWLRRLGVVYFKHRDLMKAQDYFLQSLVENPMDVDSLNGLAVIAHYRGNEAESLKFLNYALKLNPAYPDTLKTLGIYYYIQKNFVQARIFLAKCLFYDPDNVQARDLLRLANKMI